MSLEEDFKGALSSWATGVSVVTTKARGLLYGLTVSSFSSVSLNPPLVLVCLSNRNRLPLMIQDSDKFGVSILASDQEEASGYFATPGREPTEGFVEIAGQWTEADIPVVKNAAAYVACKFQQAVDQGDHTVIIGEVIEAHSRPDAKPLIYFKRGYRDIAID
jgi:flavin reductase (DIM6/NTAB) family NADH-FMN oxidoreductase RutF